jgi:hypothetical protein
MRLIRKLFTLAVLCAALTAVSLQPAPASAGGVFCFDAPIESGCFGWICCNEWGGCWCAG